MKLKNLSWALLSQTTKSEVCIVWSSKDKRVQNPLDFATLGSILDSQPSLVSASAIFQDGATQSHCSYLILPYQPTQPPPTNS